ncbi:MAG: ATP-binding protein [Eubacteriales bacterium]|nr:ATP-binding protein [Eubacteriales bacterium]MDD4324577.1 ATP-binding protein [Eubacteriales bacterium]MDD4540815.1 ATP-binding protein [Eubacteriales bacterium]
MEMFLYIVIAVVSTMLLMTLVFRSLLRKISERKDQEFLRTINQIANERAEANAILASLSIGVVAYGSDHRLIASNELSREMLGHIPDTIDSFLNLYGSENGMRASFLIRASEVSGIYEKENRVYQLKCEPRHLDKSENRFAGHVIMIQDVTESTRLEEERRAFVANVSHELKTPLTTIKSYTETLLDWGLEEKDKQSVRKDVTRIYDDSLRMESLIADLLLLSSIDSKAHYMNARVLDMGSLCRQITERLRPSAEDKYLQFECLVLPASALVFGDANSIERIVTNLVINAIKYTPKRGRVQISVGNIADDIYVKVKDTGSGIPAQDLPNLFDRFYRVDKTGSRQYGGTGLGLSIAHELTELHYGRLEVESQPGRGSAFTLFLPRADRYLIQIFLRLVNKDEVDDILGKAAVQTLSRILSESDWEVSTGPAADREHLARVLEKIRQKVNNKTE